MTIGRATGSLSIDDLRADRCKHFVITGLIVDLEIRHLVRWLSHHNLIYVTESASIDFLLVRNVPRVPRQVVPVEGSSVG